MLKVVFLDRASLPVTVRQPRFEHEWQEYEHTSSTEVVSRIQDAHIVITNKVALAGKVLAQAPQVKMIAAAATGTDNIDLSFCREQGIVVSNIRDYALHSVPEHVFTLILALRRNLLGWRADMQNDLWQSATQFCLFTQPMHDLYGSTLGILGGGALGRAVAYLGTAFGMKVLFAEHKNVSVTRPNYTAFDEVLRQADVISVHAPLTAETRHFIAEREFNLMKHSALLINTARGNLVDEAALEQALLSGRIAGAGFDVLSEEPPRQGNCLLDLNLPNFIVTPHVAWSSQQAMQTLAEQLIDNIEAYTRGEPRNRVA